MIHQRPYQLDILDRVRDALRSGRRRVMVVAPTGSGKTAMFAEIARSAAARRNRVLIIVHRREIMEQTLAALFRLGVVAGQIASGRVATTDAIQVAMVGTLVNRLDMLRRPNLIIVDEGHHAVSPTWRHVIDYWSEAPVLLWSATPERLDGRGLCEVADAIIEGPTIASLVRDGWLAPPVLYRPPHEVDAKYHVKRGDFDTGEQVRVMSERRIVGDVIEHYRRHLGGLPVVVFCISIEHSRLMARRFEEAGYCSRVVWGDMPKPDREAAIQGLATGQVQVVCSCDVISEGVDVPVMAGAILLRRTQSLALYLQQAGRALRPVWPVGFDPNAATAEERIAAMEQAGKPAAIILDHAGNYALHGHVLADRAWSLDAKSRRERAERAPTTTTCPECFGVWPGTPRTCPECGHSFEVVAPRADHAKIKVIEGELVAAGVESGEASGLAALVEKASRMKPADRQKMMLGLVMKAADKRTVDALEKAIGYRKGWSRIAWNWRQGRRVV